MLCVHFSLSHGGFFHFASPADVGLLIGYVLYRLPIELGSMDLDTFSR
jgi:hypothetical protein